MQHLPFAVFRRAKSNEVFRPGVALGDQIIDLAQLAAKKPFSGLAAEALDHCAGTTLNALMALGDAQLKPSARPPKESTSLGALHLPKPHTFA